MKKTYIEPSVKVGKMDVNIIATSGESTREPDLTVVEVEEGEYEGRAKQFYNGYSNGATNDVTW